VEIARKNARKNARKDARKDASKNATHAHPSVAAENQQKQTKMNDLDLPEFQ
jgi:hypothetical protein